MDFLSIFQVIGRNHEEETDKKVSQRMFPFHKLNLQLNCKCHLINSTRTVHSNCKFVYLLKV